MPTDWIPINTAFKDKAGAGFDGYLLATLHTPLRLANGGIVQPFRNKYPVDAGVAEEEDGTAMKLPITEDANPEGAQISLALLDAQGRKSIVGPVVIPRPAVDGAAVDLAELLPVGEV